MSFLDRIAGAPITWGVDGSPGWGYLMNSDRVLDEMASVGLAATELGPDGYLGSTPDEVTDAVDQRGLELVGGFVPALLYRPDRLSEVLDYVERASSILETGGATVAVIGPSADQDGYEVSVDLGDSDWLRFVENLNRVQASTEAHNLTAAVHPHWGMVVERRAQVERLLTDSDISLCLDTGHLALAGADPVEIARMSRGRVAHVHLKDIDPDMAAMVRDGRIGFRKAVIDGLFRPLGLGSIDIGGFIAELESHGYEGWYVIEQDVSLTGEPSENSGPVADAKHSIEFLRSLSSVSTGRGTERSNR